jgi:hypothetical protein
MQPARAHRSPSASPLHWGSAVAVRHMNWPARRSLDQTSGQAPPGRCSGCRSRRPRQEVQLLSFPWCFSPMRHCPGPGAERRVRAEVPALTPTAERKFPDALFAQRVCSKARSIAIAL